MRDQNPNVPAEPKSPWVQPGLVSAFGRPVQRQPKPVAVPFLDTRPPADRS
jgi:hypothetical protein